MTTVAASFATGFALLPPGETPGPVRLNLTSPTKSYELFIPIVGGNMPGDYTYTALRLSGDRQRSIGQQITGAVTIPPGADTTEVPTAVTFAFS